MIPWATIETLTPGALSIATVGGSPRDFADCRRVLQRLLAKTPALYDGITTLGIADIVHSVRDRAEGIEFEIATESGRHELQARPVFGPAGDVHAVRLWAGSSADPTPTPGGAVGAIWDLATQTLQMPSGIVSLTGLSAEEYVPTMSIAELFQRMPTFDRHAEVLDLLYNPRLEAKLQCDVTVSQGAGRPGRWRITMRARDDIRTRGAWLLIEDVTSDDAPLTWMTLERAGLREAHRRAGTHLAVVQVEHASISHWLTEPAPWIRWNYLFCPVEVFHPDDRERLAATGQRLQSGECADVIVRMLDHQGGYTPTSVSLFPYPGYASQHLAIARLDPVQLPSDGAAAPDIEAGPIGYDEQLRRCMTRQVQISVG
ncbi:GAF domain-containing protein [Nocardia brasiliensis]|uniref:GAF domain-containing protein n=1 Tax=Nocardia brasiliensis TaxID=37326 RepID=UPI002458F143|nr:GAF domain-containing protein [Nocardia brasiliensis]